MFARASVPFALLVATAWAAFAPPPGIHPPSPAEDSVEDLMEDHAAWRERILDDGRSLPLEDLSGNSCVPCHLDVAAEWSHSQHALAWQDEIYRKELKGVRRESRCWGCHVPALLDGTDRMAVPPARTENRHLGVDCNACHLAEDGVTVLGPHGLETSAHPTRASDLFLASNGRSTLCIGCHDQTIGPVIGIARDFVETDQHELDHSCIGCHMPGLERPIANTEDGTRLEPRRARSHRIETPRDPLFLRQAFRLTARVENGASILRIENMAGHRVPGLVDREIRFEVRVMDTAGKELAKREVTFDHRSYLPVEESREVRLDAVGTRLAVQGYHRPPTVKRAQRFWTTSVDL